MLAFTYLDCLFVSACLFFKYAKEDKTSLWKKGTFVISQKLKHNVLLFMNHTEMITNLCFGVYF